MIQHALAVAQEAAHRAGEVILSYYSSSYEIQSKGVDNPVTVVREGGAGIIADARRRVSPIRVGSDFRRAEVGEYSGCPLGGMSTEY